MGYSILVDVYAIASTRYFLIALTLPSLLKKDILVQSDAITYDDDDDLLTFIVKYAVFINSRNDLELWSNTLDSGSTGNISIINWHVSDL